MLSLCLSFAPPCCPRLSHLFSSCQVLAHSDTFRKPVSPQTPISTCTQTRANTCRSKHYQGDRDPCEDGARDLRQGEREHQSRRQWCESVGTSKGKVFANESGQIAFLGTWVFLRSWVLGHKSWVLIRCRNGFDKSRMLRGLCLLTPRYPARCPVPRGEHREFPTSQDPSSLIHDCRSVHPR
jgi:hypothetical protein